MDLTGFIHYHLVVLQTDTTYFSNSNVQGRTTEPAEISIMFSVRLLTYFAWKSAI